MKAVCFHGWRSCRFCYGGTGARPRPRVRRIWRCPAYGRRTARGVCARCAGRGYVPMEMFEAA